MITKECLKEKYDKIHEHFNFKDFLGLSALIFGLLLSNTSLEKNTANAQEKAQTETKIEKLKKIEAEEKQQTSVKKKKTSQKRQVLKPSKGKQRITAARKAKKSKRQRTP